MAGLHDMTEDELLDHLRTEAAMRACELRVRPTENEIRAALFSPDDPHADQEMVEVAYGPDRRTALVALAELFAD